MSEKYDELINYVKDIEVYNNACTVLSWDMETTTPQNGIDTIVNTMGILSTKAFEMSTSEKMEQMLNGLMSEEESEKLDELQKAVVKEMKRSFDENKNVPVDFYTEYSMHIAKAQNVWQNAKRNNDYESFKPYLEKNIEMTKKLYNYMKGEGKGNYDSMLDDYERGMNMEVIDRLFNELKAELIPLVKAISQKPQPDRSKFTRKCPAHKQKEFCRYLLEYIGFNMESGVMAESEHPFTSNVDRNDVRITNHYYENDFLNAAFSVIHEGGHGIFEQNCDEKYDHTPFEGCRYMGLHESQSRFYENILARNINFWKPVMPKLYEIFPEFSDITLEELYREVNRVQNGFIRVDSDEVTYCFHIILRYELEREMFNGNVSVDELPKLWADKMEEYLGIRPETDDKGVLQDTHWGGGMFGYFPTYLLGSIYDGMFLEKIEEELGDIDTILAEGRIKEITSWLNENVHKYGSYREPMQVISQVCGKELSVKPLIKYFKEKYTRVYDL